MKTYSPPIPKGRCVAGHDVNHHTADQPKDWAKKSAKALKHAARQHSLKQIKDELT